MQSQQQISPIYIFFLTIPPGLSQGFVTVALPYILTQHGFSVAQSAEVVAIGFSANLCRFLWGPIVDLTLSMKKWFWISLFLLMASLLLLCLNSFQVRQQAFITLLVFISQVAATFMLLPIAGFIAKRVGENQKGKASGWYQAGSLVGVGVGGGAGLWLANHHSVLFAGLTLCLISVLFALVVVLIRDIPRETEKTIIGELAEMGKDILSLVKVPLTLFVIVLMFLPTGTGAAANLWSAIAKDWNTNADTVALVTGLLSGLVSAVGCVAGGFIIDKWGNWVAYFGSAVICAVFTAVMALMPFEPYTYVIGVLAYTFGIGLSYSAFTSIILFAIGKRNVATKYTLLASAGNLPVVYMTAIDGWAHDKYNSRFMLLLEAGIGILFVLIFVFILKRLMDKKLIPVTAR